MKEYISREAAIALIEKKADGYSYLEAPTDTFIDWVNAIPAANVVEVVRCRDCKWNDLCRELHEYKGVNGYCSRGERREEKQKEVIDR